MSVEEGKDLRLLLDSAHSALGADPPFGAIAGGQVFLDELCLAPCRPGCLAVGVIRHDASSVKTMSAATGH
jgi:hypothetical protein